MLPVFIIEELSRGTLNVSCLKFRSGESDIIANISYFFVPCLLIGERVQCNEREIQIALKFSSIDYSNCAIKSVVKAT